MDRRADNDKYETAYATASPARDQGSRSERARVPKSAWWALTVLTALYVCSYLDRYVMTMLVTDIQASLKMSDFQMGLVLGPAFALFFAIFSIPLAWAADRYSRRWVIFAGALMFGLATALSGIVISFNTLLLARVFVAVGEASLGPAALALLADKFPRERMSTAISIFATGPKIGGTAAYGVGGITLLAMAGVAVALPGLSDVEPWRLTFFAIGIPSILVAGLLFTFSEPPVKTRKAMADQGEGRDDVVQFFKSERRLFIPLLLGFSAMSICGNSLIAWLPTFSQRSFGWPPDLYGPLLSAVSFAGAISLPIKGMIMDRLFAKGVRDIHIRFYSWLLMATLPLALTIFFIPNGVWFFVPYAVVGVVAIPWTAYASVCVQMVTPPNLRGRVWGAMLIPLITAGGIGPVLVGLLTDEVFGDPAKIGWSLATVMGIFIPAALFCMRLCLRHLNHAVERAMAAEAR